MRILMPSKTGNDQMLQRTRSRIKHNFRDLTGMAFNRLTVLERAENTADGSAQWKCRCECGSEVIIKGSRISHGRAKSCGCIAAEKTSQRSKKHGLAGTREYGVWRAMKQRCLNPNDKSYKNYGGRGITVCPEWAESFDRFKADMGPKPTPKHTLERRDNDKGYSPSNCCWATRKEQIANQRPSLRWATVDRLIDQETGKLNRDVFSALVRREAMRTFGSSAPRYLREAAKSYRDHVTQQVVAWRQARGLHVSMSLVAPYGAEFDGVRWSAF